MAEPRAPRPLSTALVPWRGPGGEPRLTVVVKATFDLREGEEAAVTDSYPLFRDVHHEDNEGRSLFVASDFAVRKPLADVLFTGSAYATVGSRVPRIPVRLAIAGRDGTLIDKSLLVLGERHADPRTGQLSGEIPFAHLPLRWELSLGSAQSVDNPVGVGLAENDIRIPRIVYADGRLQPAGFGPLSPTWGDRAAALHGVDPALLREKMPVIPPQVEFQHFNCAPRDQRIRHLHGDEEILIAGLHPMLSELHTRLPGLRPDVTLLSAGDARAVQLVADTLWIEGDKLRCTVTWRADLEVTEDIADGRQGTRIFAELVAIAPKPPPVVVAPGLAGPRANEALPKVAPRHLQSTQMQTPPGAAPRNAPESPEQPKKPLSSVEPKSFSQTQRISTGERGEKAAVGKEWFGSTMSATAMIPGWGEPSSAQSPPSSASSAWASAPIERADFSTSYSAMPSAAGAWTAAPPISVVVPAGAAAAAAVPIAEPAARAAANPMAAYFAALQRSQPSTATIPPGFINPALDAIAEAAAEQETYHPRPVAAASESKSERDDRDDEQEDERDDEPTSTALPTVFAGVSLPLTAQLAPPARFGEVVPILNITPLQIFTFAWQLKPPQDALVVVVKATYRIGDRKSASAVGGEASLELLDDQDPPQGDVPFDDDEPSAIRYPSDFAPFKPRADVLLVGHAVPGADPGMGVVTFRFGALQKKLAVFGDRKWITSGASKPEPFERMPLRWERALGGPLSDVNPVGIGFKTGVRAPNLENPERLLHAASAIADPACFAPIPPTWKARRSKLGTYDARWFERRWPYLPEDVDWSYFNAAPRAMQIAYPQGDERFEITGVGRAPIVGRLPGAAPRVFAQRTAMAGGDFFEVLLRLDTVWFDTDARKVTLVWRGLCETTDEEAPEISTLFVLLDAEGERTSLQAARARMDAEIVARSLAPARIVDHDQPANEAQSESLSAVYTQLASMLDSAAAERRKLDAAGHTPAPTPPAETLESRFSGPPTADPELPGEPPAVARSQIMQWLADGESLAGRDLTGVDLAAMDLSGVDLSAAVLRGAILRGTKLDSAKLMQSSLESADLSQASLRGADLSGADLAGAKLDSADFTEAILHAATFELANAFGAKFNRCRATGTGFVGARLVNASFDDAVLEKADFTEALLEGASLLRANLTDAKFYDCEGMDVKADEAVLTNLRADDARLPHASMRKVSAAGSNWNGADLGHACFDEAVLTGASFERATLEFARLHRADITEGRFRRARLRDAGLLKANLMGATFERADLERADLRGANLYQVETWKAKMSQTRLELAFVAGSKLETR